MTTPPKPSSFDHSPDCAVNDANPDGIKKPCNCGKARKLIEPLIREANELRCQVVELRQVLFHTRCALVLFALIAIGLILARLGL